MRKRVSSQTTSIHIHNKGYSEAGASYRKKALKGMLPNSGSAHEDIDNHNYTLRQRSGMLFMGSAIASSAIKTNRTNVIGNGLQLKSTINREVLGMTQEQAEKWKKHTEAEFELWATDKRAYDATGRNDFYTKREFLVFFRDSLHFCAGFFYYEIKYFTTRRTK